MALLEVKDLSFTYNGESKKALDGVSFTLDSGEILLLCGESGCGKTTLLKLLKPQLAPFGKREGEILYCGKDISALDERRSSAEIGFVMQDPDAQTVTDKVWHELAFGLEGLGLKSDVIRRRVAEVCGFFGIGEWYSSNVWELSGGQKQLLSLASVMACEPELLLLDEPTAQLDPISASEFFASLRRVSEELGVAIIIAEHRLEEIFPIADRVMMMDGAGVYAYGAPREIGEKLSRSPHRLREGMPAAVRLFSELGGEGASPLTVKEGKRYVRDNFGNGCRRLEPPLSRSGADGRERAIEIRDGYFRYTREQRDILNGLSLTVYGGEMLCILGANGSGKTTLLRVLAGLGRMYRGRYLLWGKDVSRRGAGEICGGDIALLPQDPRVLFVKDTLLDELCEITSVMRYPKDEGRERIDAISKKLGIDGLYGRHPYDLSGGERQKAALAKLLLREPRILLLDEPTKGLDAYSKNELARLLCTLRDEGRTVVTVTHDVEFAAEHSDRSAMFFDGQIVSVADRVEFFASNRYYTTVAARMTRPMLENAVTVSMAAELCRLNGRRDTGDDE